MIQVIIVWTRVLKNSHRKIKINYYNYYDDIKLIITRQITPYYGNFMRLFFRGFLDFLVSLINNHMLMFINL